MTSRRDFVGACVFGSVFSAAGGASGEDGKPADGKPAAGERKEAAEATSEGGPKGGSADVAPPVPTPAVKDARATIVRAMRERWKKPERLMWRIAYHPIVGMSSQSSWHIEGTHWWVRIYPAWTKLAEFDTTKVYELDAVALAQNYGVIDFYVYEHRKVT